MGDDGVGWKVVEKLSTAISQQSSVEVDTAALGGLSLMERLIGYERVIIVDSMETGQSPVGSVSVFPLASLPDPMAGHSASAHDATLITALRTAEQLGADIPRQIDIVAIEAENVYDFSEELSHPVAAAVPLAVEKIIELLNRE